MPLAKEIQERVDKWLNGPFDEKTKETIRTLLKENPEELSDAFFQDLSFGTGGLRGIMGIGTNRMNPYTVEKATQGLANYLKKQHTHTPKVFIGFDTRHHSQDFAEIAASVLLGNQIEVFLSKEFCPTPLVSFGCRQFKADAAIMITASHNPPQYNGYKVYGKTGGQIVPPEDQAIVEEASKEAEIQRAPLTSSLLHLVGNEIDDAYFNQLKTLKTKDNTPISVTYTNLHGTGSRLMPKALDLWGVETISFVETQKAPDGDFPNAPSPNPEEEKTLRLGIDQMLQEGSNLLLATDPDADRLGVVINHNNAPYRFNGHQIAVLCLYHLCRHHPLPKNPLFVRSIVTTELFQKIAKGTCIEVLTGFKYIADTIEKHPNHSFVFGAEESYGYLFAPFLRDKDAISTACLIAEMVFEQKKQNKTLKDLLDQIDEEYGIYCQHLLTFRFEESQEGMLKMKTLLKKLRETPPQKIDEEKVISYQDYALPKGSLPPTNMIELRLENATRTLLRPSGTEPMIKVYIECQAIGSEDRVSCQRRTEAFADLLKTSIFS